ncbi:MAG TPA: hypothetical protein VFC65_11170 [Prolixibacteraceae bacterium]|nr:hypothetical protein [Prolixibacteraceae bacterium]
MALGKSINFVKQFIRDQEFRSECNKSTKLDLLSKLDFTELEFDDAINMQLVKCQSYEEADRVQQVKLWFAFL